MVIDNIYNKPYLPPLKINPDILRKLLLTCTTEVPFHDDLGNIYVQTDGVSMGSVLTRFSVIFTCPTSKIEFLIA